VIDARGDDRSPRETSFVMDALDGKTPKKYLINTQSLRSDYPNSTRKSQRVVSLVTGIE
jgi:hypothetical protein